LHGGFFLKALILKELPELFIFDYFWLHSRLLVGAVGGLASFKIDLAQNI
jgi:hypothetical protein